VEDRTHKLRAEVDARVTGEIFVSTIFRDRNAVGLPPINPDMITYSNGAALVLVPLRCDLHAVVKMRDRIARSNCAPVDAQ
jgi:hypothetical protein